MRTGVSAEAGRGRATVPPLVYTAREGPAPRAQVSSLLARLCPLPGVSAPLGGVGSLPIPSFQKLWKQGNLSGPARCASRQEQARPACHLPIQKLRKQHLVLSGQGPCARRAGAGGRSWIKREHLSNTQVTTSCPLPLAPPSLNNLHRVPIFTNWSSVFLLLRPVLSKSTWAHARLRTQSRAV